MNGRNESNLIKMYINSLTQMHAFPLSFRKTCKFVEQKQLCLRKLWPPLRTKKLINQLK